MSALSEEIARKLDNSEYREFDDAVVRLAKDNNIVIISGASDDIISLAGAIDDEVGVGEFRLSPNGLLEPIKQVLEQALENIDYGRPNATTSVITNLKNWISAHEASNVVTGEFSNGWVFSTTAPHQRFTILEDGDVQGQGLVIDLLELKA